MRLPFVHPLFTRFRMVQSSVRALFCRLTRRFRGSGVRGGRAVARAIEGVRSAARHSRLDGFAALEPRAMLAANDVFVQLEGGQVVLALDPAGTAITDLSTSYSVANGVLTIKAATAGTISTILPPTSGITVDRAADTIAVNLNTLPGFTGISVAGNVGADVIRVGPGGINLSAVTKGAAAQGFVVDTGAGAADRIAVANRIVTKGAGPAFKF